MMKKCKSGVITRDAVYPVIDIFPDEEVKIKFLLNEVGVL